jgi:predicted metal-dependent HD superfamily phosphohydrolase
MNLQERHSELLVSIGVDPNEIKGLWQNLENAYSGKSRHYHNLNHLQEMIELFDIYQGKLKNPNEVLYSIFYHDYVYKATRKDNELKSAELALAILPDTISLNKPFVFDAICATQLHQHNEIEDINWLIDFDLKILSKDWEAYQTYCNQIRKEYKIYPNFLYKPGRKKALEHFLEQDSIYKTDIFRNLFDEKAKDNIKREISLLS